MIDESRIALNRVLCPRLSLEEFFRLAAELGLHKVELRNDLPGGKILDGLQPPEVVDLCMRYGIQIITINALQKFNLPPVRHALFNELVELIETAESIRCQAVVLCPNNDAADHRSPEQIRSDTVRALKEFAPLFEGAGITGLLEPLGFRESSLDSLVTAMEIIEECGYKGYRIVHDTFHHRLGPDTGEILEKKYDVRYTGLIHISGVEEEIPFDRCRDADRGLIGPADRLGSRGQVQMLLRLGYDGDISYEPFSPEVQDLSMDQLKRALGDSLSYLRG
jgi:2-keto-myo-inositol isomerase